MNEPIHQKFSLDLEVKEVERKSRAGCNSSSTSPRCTCPPPISLEEGR